MIKAPTHPFHALLEAWDKAQRARATWKAARLDLEFKLDKGTELHRSEARARLAGIQEGYLAELVALEEALSDCAAAIGVLFMPPGRALPLLSVTLDQGRPRYVHRKGGEA